MGKTIQIKRGPKNTMPTLAQGELGMTTDSGAEGLFIGTGTKNIEMARKSDLNISGQISTHNSNSSAHSDIRKSVTTHTGNTSIHVTAEEKNAWNAKLDSYTETDPTVPAWAKAKSKPSYTASEVGAVPTSRKVNGKALSSDITLSASDVSARPSSWTPSASDVGAVPTSRTVNGKALSSDITLSASDVGAAPASHTSDSTIHVTTEEKATWNAKADAQFKPAGKSYLTFSSPSSFTLKVNNTTKHWNGTLEYFTSDRTWTVWDGRTTLSAVDNDGEYVIYIRGTGNTVITGNSSNYRWVLTGSNIACIGNIENLLDYATVQSGAHPTMASKCYRYMFYKCTSLTQAPALPATTLESNCYNQMFNGCTSLTQAPALPATTLVDHCYFNMFNSCTSLTQAPALPATTLADYCYYEMFSGCTSLTQAPALPATTLANNCYQSMFFGCSSLTQAPALPATTLAISCYTMMFYNCTSLTQAPALPATTLADYCYDSMFYGCTNLKLSSSKTDEYTQEYRIPSSGSGTTATDALTNMFASTGGTFTGTPDINATYYLSSDNMVVHDAEVATLREYVGSMIDAAYSYGTEDLEAGTSSLETGKLYFVYE